MTADEAGGTQEGENKDESTPPNTDPIANALRLCESVCWSLREAQRVEREYAEDPLTARLLANLHLRRAIRLTTTVSATLLGIP